MSSRWAVLSLLLLATACSSYELAAVALRPVRFDVRPLAAVAAPAEEWSDAELPTELEDDAAQDPEAADAGADAWSRHVTIYLGRRNYSDGNLDQSFVGGGDIDLKDSGFKGIEIESCDEETGHGFDVGVSIAYQTDSVDVASFDYKLVTEEFYGGYRHTFRTRDQENIWHPFLGAGLSVIRAHIDSPPFPPYEDDASALAGYVKAGMTWEIGLRLRLGLDVRELFGTDDLTIGTPTGTTRADVDNEQIAFTIGYLL